MHTVSSVSIPGLVLLLLMPLCGVSLAAEKIPSREDRELVMAAVGIGMTEAQRLQFRDEIAEFLKDYRSAMLKIVRGHNATDLERKMEKKHESLLRGLDADMAEMLTPAQLQRYAAYRQRLALKLTQPLSTDSSEYLDWATEIPPANHH